MADKSNDLSHYQDELLEVLYNVCLENNQVFQKPITYPINKFLQHLEKLHIQKTDFINHVRSLGILGDRGITVFPSLVQQISCELQNREYEKKKRINDRKFALILLLLSTVLSTVFGMIGGLLTKLF